MGKSRKMKIRFGKSKIAAKFLFWFLLVALLPLGAVGYVNYRIAEKALKRQVLDNLTAIAESRVHRFESYIFERERDVATLARTPTIIEAMEKFNKAFKEGGIDSPAYKFMDDELRPFLTYYKEAFGFSDLFLISSDGDAVFSVMKGKDLGTNYYAGPYENSEIAKVFDRAKTLLDIEVSDFEYYPASGEPAAFIAAPVFEKGGVVGISMYEAEKEVRKPAEKQIAGDVDISLLLPTDREEVYGLVQEPRGSVIGIVAFQMSNEEVYTLVKDYTGLGETGETVIATRKSDRVVFLSPVRHDPRAAFRRKMAIGSSRRALPIQEAVRGKKGSGTTIDYRGKEVLAVWRYLPYLRWGMVVKIDTEEAFAAVLNLKERSLDIGIITALAVILLAFLISKSVSDPIAKLTQTTKLIASGILTAKIDIKQEDEIGQLADSFNKMTEDLKKARDDLERHAAELEKVNRELDSFVYTASHDLQAPLRGIASFAAFLEEDCKGRLNEEGRDYINEIRRGADRMNDMLRDLRTLSHISRIKNPYEDVKINDIINSVIEQIKFDIKEYNVDLKVQRDLPTINCDRIKMSTVFLNLINNAIKFSSKVRKNPEVEIGYIKEKKCHKFFVKDNGIGIEPRYNEQIFGVFQRLHTDKEYKGTGVGLSIVKRIIDEHGGRIWVESEPGRGATFYFTIPKDLKTWKKIGEILIEDGLITEERLREKLKKQKMQG